MNLEIIGEITAIKTVAKGSGIRDINRLRRIYGPGNWKKMKGIAHIRLFPGKSNRQNYTGMRLMV